MPATILEHSGDLEMMGKKAKKKKRQKEEENIQCSNGPHDETERAEPPSKKCIADDEISKKGAGMRAGRCLRAFI